MAENSLEHLVLCRSKISYFCLMGPMRPPGGGWISTVPLHPLKLPKGRLLLTSWFSIRYQALYHQTRYASISMKPTNCEHNFTLNSMAKIYFRKSGGSPLLRFSDFSGKKKVCSPWFRQTKNYPQPPSYQTPNRVDTPKILTTQ